MSTKPSLAGSLADTIERAQGVHKAQASAAISFADFLASPDFAGPYLGGRRPSPVVRAVVDASEGRSPRLDDASMQQIFRCGRAGFGGIVPRVVVLGAGRRGGKTSRLLAPKMVHAAWTVPLPDLAPGEIARSLVIAPDLDLAEACFNYAKGLVESSPVLRTAVVKSNTEEVVIRRPDGRLCEIVTGAATRGGRAGRSRTLVFAGLDEACFFFADDGHTVNDRGIYTAILPAFGIPPAPGAQLWITSTPWIEAEGLMEEEIAKHWGKPGGTLVAARVSSYQLRGIEDDGSLREGYDEDTYQREILAHPLPAGSATFFTGTDIAAALELQPPTTPHEELGAGGDFAFDRDSSALALVHRHPGGMFAARKALERFPPLIDTQVCAEFAREVVQFRLDRLAADSWLRKSISGHLIDNGVNFVDAPAGRQGKVETYIAVKSLLADHRLALGALPEPMRKRLQVQLRQVVAKSLPGGAIQISSPRGPSRLAMAMNGATAGGHGDVVSALVLALWMAGSTQPDLWSTAKEDHFVDDHEADDPYERGFDGDDLRWRD